MRVYYDLDKDDPVFTDLCKVQLPQDFLTPFFNLVSLFTQSTHVNIHIGNVQLVKVVVPFSYSGRFNR